MSGAPNKIKIAMRKIYLLLIISNISYFAYSQNVKITYNYDYALNAINNKVIRTDRMLLNIGKNSSEFYSILAENIRLLQDSMLDKGFSASEIMREKAKLPKSTQNQRIYKNYPAKGEMTYIDKQMQWYKYVEKEGKPEWNLESERKTILGYSCQKATTKLRGREWVAWFTNEVPIQDGPWKLWGLPGLILEAHDSQNLYSFQAIGIKKTDSDEPIIEMKEQYVSCTREEFIKLKIFAAKNPEAFMNQSLGAGVSVQIQDSKGNPSKGYDYEDIENDIK